MMGAGRSHRAASVLAAAAAAATLLLSGPATARLSGAASPSAAVKRLQQEISAVLAAPPLTAGTWGIVVQSLSRRETLFETNGEKLLIPSSNMKIVTLAAAAQRLGWDYTFETSVSASGTIEGGTLDGDLIVSGSGDPTIENWAGDATRLFREWADQIKAAGIHAVTGRLVGDDRAFAGEGLGSGWAWDDLDRSYATSVGALQFNENTAQIRITPGTAVGADAAVSAEPPSAGLIVRSLVKTAARTAPAAITTERAPSGATLVVRGTVPVGARALVRNVSVVNPTLYFVNELRQALIADGVDIRGPGVGIGDLTDTPVSLRKPAAIVVHRSPPLSELAATMMRLSQNLYGETLLRALGAWAGTPTTAGGLVAVRKVMDEWNIPTLGYTQADGSGLSPYNVLSAATLVSILTHVDGDARLRAPFRAALPVAGREGTLENRMKGTPAQGNARAKTGSLTNAHSLSGYVTSAEGEPLVFSILANNFGVPAETIDRTIDEIVVRLAMFSRK
jgi:D-alanyl-D-alanine carboxypeptidase/D-alanyl-D-alanine-endopeptidase (penicillin-binding protein 4)